MLKHALLLIVFSTLAIFFKEQLVHVMHGLLIVHNYIASMLARVFSNDKAGAIIQGVLSLILIPVIAGVVVLSGFFMVKREAMPHTLITIWIMWVILLVTLVAQAG